jgi:hypothetical protein
MGLWNPTLRKVREDWGTLGAEARFLFGGLYAALKRRSSTVLHAAVLLGCDRSRALPGRGAFRILRGMGLWNPVLREVREGLATLVRGGVGLQQVPFGFAHSRFLAGLSAQFGMTKCVKACGAA